MPRTQNLGGLLIQSLGDAVAYERDELSARTRTRELTLPEVTVDAPPRYTDLRVRAARLKLGYSQPVFARALNVSVQTVRAWEQGTRIPDGPTRRLLELAEEAPEVLARCIRCP